MGVVDVLLGLIVIQLTGVLIATLLDRDQETLTHYLVITLWPVLLPWVAVEKALQDRGFWLRWRGAMDDEELQTYRSGIRWEDRLGPFHWGHYRRDINVGQVDKFSVNRWVGVGRQGGKGITVGRGWGNLR